jgi:UDP-glucose 4-epimerase
VKVLVTGANGFVGKRLCEVLASHRFDVVSTTRKAAPGCVAVGDLDGHTAWGPALQGCDAVIHLAARVHVMSDGASDPLKAYREVNVEGTINLARQAVEAGVKRFVFVSSIKVNGESTGSHPFTAEAVPAPLDPYGQSKMEAEIALRAIGKETGLEVVIVRPPLVYGPGVKANFHNLVKLVDRGIPLPLGSASGRRSMVALDNLVDLLTRCLEHPDAPGETFLVSDGSDMTVRELVEQIAAAMEKRIVLFSVSPRIIRGAARIIGKPAVADRLFGALQVDITRTRKKLDWTPPVTPDVAIRKTVEAFSKPKSQTSR